MDPPSYNEASLHPPALVTEAHNIPPPPSYDASLSMPSTPPPSYGETVTIQPDPFPLLASSTLSAAVMSPPQHPRTIIHPSTQIGVTQTVGSIQNQTVVMFQPQSGESVSLTSLTDVPRVITCPICHNVVTTTVKYFPGKAAWCTCIFLTLMGLVCGCCLIPFMVRGLQDAHHSCPQCGNNLYIYKR